MNNSELKKSKMTQVLRIAEKNNSELDKPMIVLVDESGVYINSKTGQVYIGGELVESKPQEVIYLGYAE